MNIQIWPILRSKASIGLEEHEPDTHGLCRREVLVFLYSVCFGDFVR
jgi:hypothetical protein